MGVHDSLAASTWPPGNASSILFKSQNIVNKYNMWFQELGNAEEIKAVLSRQGDKEAFALTMFFRWVLR